MNAVWRKSSRSADTSNCVEVAFTSDIGVRDSKNPTGPTLAFPAPSWSTFVSHDLRYPTR